MLVPIPELLIEASLLGKNINKSLKHVETYNYKIIYKYNTKTDLVFNIHIVNTKNR